MIDAVYVWQSRVGAFRREVIRYAPYIGNSGTLTFLILALIFCAYQYSRLLPQLPQAYPYEWAIALMFSFIVTRGNIRTFLRSADLLFLLPMEGKLNPYFFRAIRYSAVVAMIPLLIALIVIWPLYTFRQLERAESFVLIFFCLSLVKLANLLAVWAESRLRTSSQRMLHRFFRWLANASLLLPLFTYGIVWPLVAAALGVGLASLFYYRQLNRLPLNWEYLLKREQRHRNRFYRFVSLFADTPHLASQVRKRRFLAKAVDRLPRIQAYTYHYLYGKIFLRSELLGIFVRLNLIGLFIVVWLPSDWGKLVAYLLLLYVTGLQLSMLARYHRYSFWFELWPLSVHQRGSAILFLVSWLLRGEAVVFSLALLLAVGWAWPFWCSLVLGIVFPALYARGLRRRFV